MFHLKISKAMIGSWICRGDLLRKFHNFPTFFFVSSINPSQIPEGANYGAWSPQKDQQGTNKQTNKEPTLIFLIEAYEQSVGSGWPLNWWVSLRMLGLIGNTESEIEKANELFRGLESLMIDKKFVLLGTILSGYSRLHTTKILLTKKDKRWPGKGISVRSCIISINFWSPTKKSAQDRYW